ncbi:MAG TPA: cytochrome P450 [Dyella sp.]|uniref:cytochrome P450 n=1 Tax=Dyella sp. TaxID=1869338 RepID=UPI002C6E91CE|nr:cytochrome P450 [Dyella sp.]HUB90147.1 cytochrome P450 [Dyella sp.]
MSEALCQSLPDVEMPSTPIAHGAQPIPTTDGHWLLGSANEFAHAAHLFVAEQGKRNQGLTQFRVLHRRFLATASPDVAHQILVTHREHYERSAHYKRLALVIGNGLAASEGATWRKRRALINPLLRGEHLKQLVPTVCDSVCEVLKEWDGKRASGTPVGLVRETQRLSMGAISRMLLSTDIDQDTAYRLGTAMRGAMQRLREYNTSPFPVPLSCPIHRNRKFNRDRETLDRFIDFHIKSRLANGQPGQPDFLSVLMSAKDPDSGQPLPLQTVMDETKTLFMAGFETTANVMAWALYLLASHPACAARWHEEVDRVLQGRLPQWDDLPRLAYITQIIQETMRLYPPAYNIARQCVREDVINGYRVPKSATILISVYGIHRDPVWGPDPEEFRPERFAQKAAVPRAAFMPFATGKHVCVGNDFSMTEMIATLAIIGQRYRLQRADDEPVVAKAQLGLVPSREIPVHLG